ncbi:MAG: iron ABC transporter permease [Chloroflexi bacterium]|nr:iron ABC transporter permease [Chloroflexota bacterium]
MAAISQNTATLSVERAAAGQRSGRWLWLALAALLLAAFVLSVGLGSVNIPLGDVLTTLTGGQPARAAWQTIILDFRLPKALTAMLAGAALAISGLQMQTLFRNPLADPFVLGINAGASLGVALVVLAVGTTGAAMLAGLGLLGDMSLTTAAVLGAALSLALVLAVARRVGSVTTLLVIGLMFGYAVGALVSLLMYFSIPERIQAFINWGFGSFGGVTWQQMPLFAPLLLAGLLLSWLSVKPLNALLLGEDYARSMGVNVRRARLGIIAGGALLAGTVTAFCGPVAFLGIAVPHVCRSLLRTSDHRALIPACLLAGALWALGADLAARLPSSEIVLPLNAVMALLGAPVVAWILWRQRGLRL